MEQPAIITRPTQAEVNYKSHADERQCQQCRWFAKAADGGPYCHLVTLTPEPIAADSSCDRHEMLTPDALMDMGKELPPAVNADAVEPPTFVDETVVIANGVVDPLPIVDDEPTVIINLPPSPPIADKAVFERIWDGITNAIKGRKDDEPQVSGIKVYGNRWLAWWTNSFEDREKEFFPAKAIDAYIARVDMGIVPYPELWAWHTPGTKHGQADYLARIGNFALASGTFDDNAAGSAAKAAYQRKGQRYQMSHGFFYEPARKQGGVYHQFNTFELTTIPAKAQAAANSFTDFQGVEPMLTPEKKAHLEELFGKETAEQIIAQTEAKDKAVAELGIAYKDFAAVDETTVETEAAKEAVESANKDFSQAFLDVTADSAIVVEIARDAVKQLAEYKKSTDATVKGLRESVAKLQEELDGKPRSASKDAATELTPERIQQMTDNVDKQSKHIDPFTGIEIERIG
jgi:hypothetical protein